MEKDQIKALFDQQADTYDQRWTKTAPINECLYLLLGAVFARLPPDARILCVGAGTGAEIDHLAQRHPNWTFVAVDPSEGMLQVCREKAIAGGYASRVTFHGGYLESLPGQEPFDAATSFLVSQFILDPKLRADFFRAIATRLHAGGILVSSDLASDATSYDAQLKIWLNMLSNNGIPAAGLEQMRAAYARDVAILPPSRIADILRAGGFDDPVPFYQAGLIHAWASTRGSDVKA